MTRNHFLNGLICQIHKHGASCAVDTLFEIFYYAMYDRELKCSLFANSNMLAKALLKGCEVRRIAGSECWVRENVWNVLANVIPYAYAPKGRPDAEILQGFMLLTQNTRNKFASSYTGQFRCSACHKQGTITTVTSSPILEYDQTVNQAFPSNLCQGLAHLIDRDIHQQLASTMQCDCGHFLLPIRGQYDMSEYLLVSLCLAGKYSRNEQKPPVNVSQFVNINQCAYELAGAVQMGSHGGHFMSIVLLPDGSYSVIDDLKNEVLNYPTFAAAVSRNSDTSLNKILQASDPGIHILLFRKIRPVKQVSGIPTAVGINSSGPPRSSGPSSICSVETSMSVPASTYPQVTSGPDGLGAPAAVSINRSGPPRSSGPSSICPMETNMAVPASTCPQVTSGPDEPGVPTAVGINSTGLPRFSRPSSICLTGPRIALSATTPPHSGIHNSGLLRSSRPSCILLEDASTAEPASSRSLSPSGSSPISPLVDMVAQIPCSSTPNHSPFELSAVPEVVSPISASSVLHPKTVVSPVGMSPSLNISKQSPDVVSESRSSSNKVKLEDISLKIETVAEMQFLSVCGSRVRYFTYDEIRYYSFKDYFVILGIQSQISSRGYGKVISTFGDISGNPFVTTPDRAVWLNEKHLFKVLLDTKAYPKSNKKKAAVYDELSSIKKKTMTKNNLCRKLAEHFDSLAHDFSGNSQFRPLSAASSPTPLSAASSPTPLSTANSPTPLSTSNSPIPCSIANSPSDFSATNSPNPLSTSIQNSPSYFGHVDFFDSVIPYIVIDESLFLSSSHVFKFLELEKHINKEGYRCIYRDLNAAGYIDPSVCFYPPDGRVKTHISIIPLLNILLNLSVGANEKKTLLHRELLKILQKIAVKQVNESTCDPDVAKFENLKNIDLATLVANKYSLEKDKFITDLSKLIGKSTFETNFALSEQDLIRLLMSRPTQQRLKIVQAAVQSCYRQLFPVSPKQTVYVADNFKGYKLLTELHRLLPGILPSEQEERAARKAYEMSFSACLQPSRISTGFQVDPSQLMSILKFRYPYIHDKLMVRLTGDGREYGGRHSTFLALSVLNNELLENNVLHQSSKECFPIALFYESDSRDNLEQNLTKPTNVISKFLQTYPSDDASFYFCSDEMFALACLDGSGELSPKSDSAWNIYGTNNADQKQKVSPEGFRTDLPPIFDRTHPECLFPEIPMVNWVFCVLHGGTRVVEKLLNLELETIGSEKHKIHLTKCGLDGTDVLHNLEANINLRGVRSGNFKIHINPNSGKPDPVSLNKNAAFDIISPPPPGMEEKFPHPLHNIIGVRIVKIPLRDSVRKFLELPKEMPELQLVMSIWESFHYMFKTLKFEPEPSNFTGCLSDSSQCQFSWGYSPEQKRLYKFHAERFYQLYCLRYTHHHLTPYMMKFIDYAPYFIENLPVPLNRFQTEGSEHMNYDHNCFYYNHTTRHGGKNKVEPLKALFLHMWRRLCHDIEFQCQD